MDGVHVRTLRRALEIVVTKDRLATALDIPSEVLDEYLTGKKALPNQAFIEALDIVANGRG